MIWDVWWLVGEGGVEAEETCMEDVGGLRVGVGVGVVGGEDVVGGVEERGHGGGHETWMLIL